MENVQTDTSRAELVLQQITSAIPGLEAGLVINPVTGELEAFSGSLEDRRELLMDMAIYAVLAMSAVPENGCDEEPDSLEEIITHFDGFLVIVRLIQNPLKLLIVVCAGDISRLGAVRMALSSIRSVQ